MNEAVMPKGVEHFRPGAARDVADRASELAAFLNTDPNLSGEVLRQLSHALNDCDRALAGLAERIGQEAPARAEA